MSRVGWCLGLVAMTTTMSLAGAARAEVPPAAPVTVPVGPDLVLLKNGGMLRGTISELVPNETVTIVTMTGKTREIAMSEVSYAGPADKAPGSEADKPAAAAPAAVEKAAANTDEGDAPTQKEVRPYVTVNGKKAQVKLKSVEPGTTFHRAASSAVAVGSGGVAVATGYERLCTAPCEVTLPAGTEVLALSRPGEAAREAGSVTLPAGESTVVGRFESRAAVRTAGWITLVASVGLGGYLLYTSSSTEQECSYGYCSDATKLDGTKLIASAVILGAGIPLGIIMGLARDKPQVRVAMQAPLPTAHGVTLNAAF